MGMRIAWDDNRYFWCGRLVPEGFGRWRLLSDVPLAMGRTVTITPLTEEGGPHVEFRATVVGQGEDVLFSPYAEGRFWTSLHVVDPDEETERALGTQMAA